MHELCPCKTHSQIPTNETEIHTAMETVLNPSVKYKKQELYVQYGSMFLNHMTQNTIK